MNPTLRRLAVAAAVSLALNAPVFSDEGHTHGHEAFASKGEEHTHGTEVGNVRTGDNAIEIYGKLYMALGYSDAGAGVPASIALSSHGSLLGVRGNQQLNESARLFWQIESEVDLDNMGDSGYEAGGNTSSFGGSDSFVGISGNAGTLLFGKHNTPLTMLVHSNDPFAHIAGDALSVLGHAGHHYENAFDPDHGTLFYVRAPNSIVYMSPAVGGFSANLALIAIDESNKDGARIPGTSLSLNFKTGDLTIAYAFERHNRLDLKTSEDPLVNPELLDKTQAQVMSAMYHFPSTMVNFTLERLEVKDDVDGNHDRMAYHLSVQQMFGPHSLRASYAYADDLKNDSEGSTGGRMLAIGWFQALSGNTQAYVVVTTVQNDARGDFGTFLVHDINPGSDPTSLAIGLIHKF